MNSPRFCTSFRPVAKSKVPAAACAVISPNDSPAAPPDFKLAEDLAQRCQRRERVNVKRRLTI